MDIQTKIIDTRLNEPGMLGYATPGSAAIDLRACNIGGTTQFESFTMYPGDRVMFGSGVAFWMAGDDDTRLPVAGLMIPRSGLGNKGLRLGNTAGLIDTDFQGQVLIAAHWTGDDPLTIRPLDRITQLIVFPYVRANLVRVPEFTNNTIRGAGGFGHTGVA